MGQTRDCNKPDTTNTVDTQKNNNKFSGYAAHVVRKKRNFGSIKYTTE